MLFFEVGADQSVRCLYQWLFSSRRCLFCIFICVWVISDTDL